MKMNLTPRERKVLLLAGCALVAILVYLAVDSTLQRYRDLDRDIAMQTEEMIKVSRLREQYVQTHSQLETIQAKLAGQKNSFSLLSFIEDLAKKENIREKIGSVKPKTLPLNDQYDEHMLELQVDAITLAQLVDFIYQIEHSGPVLKVKRLRIKSQYNDRNLLNVTMQVATFTQKG
jgi:type II secretory pathway component PulM